jgi:ubiquinol-cytochrome c reductase cytochrome c subunit
MSDSEHAGVTPGKRNRRRAKLRRKLSGLLALVVALVGAGALYSVLAPSPHTAHAQGDAALVQQGKDVFDNTCITCHGAHLEGVQGRGPSLIGVGSSAVYFQTATGRMPLASQGAQARAKPPALSPKEIRALMAYVQATGGGPEAPDVSGEALKAGDSAQGGQLFRMNCASCHNYTGRGGALTSGKFAPSMQGSAPRVIYTAMQSGPQNMPRFSDRQLTPKEKQDIIAYVNSVQNNRNNPGGLALGGLGPVPEGLVAWAVGITALVGVTLWIGAKA